MNNYLNIQDPEIFGMINLERERQDLGLEMIASENYVSPAVMEAQGSILTNKYAEGYPNKRYYGGCEFVDRIEELAISRACELFGCKFANVQPHSGSQANMAAYFSVLNPGDTILGMDLAQGGHLTHGSPVNFSGKLFNVVSYGLNPETETLGMEMVRDIAHRHRPKMIVAGASAYPRIIDFKGMRDIADEVGAYLLVDMAHIAGLVATGFHPSPLPHAHLVTSTTHKTLRGPRGGLILTNDPELAKKINFNLFPGIQGGPLEHVIAAKAVAFKEALAPEFKNYQKEVIQNAQTLAQELINLGIELVSNGTDNHLLLLKTDSVSVAGPVTSQLPGQLPGPVISQLAGQLPGPVISQLAGQLTGKDAERILEKAGITCNKNMIPGDKRSPFITSGVRLGTPAITTRGLKSSHMKTLANWIHKALTNHENELLLNEIHQEVKKLCLQFPVYKN